MRTLRALSVVMLAAVAAATAYADPRDNAAGRGGGGQGFSNSGHPSAQVYGRPQFGPTRYYPSPQHAYPPPQRAYGPPQRAYGPPAGPYAPPTPPLAGRWREQEEPLRQGVRRGELAPLGRVIGDIQRVSPGRQLDANIEYMGGRPVYRVRWMTAGGARQDVYVDAATGAIIGRR